MGGQGSGRHWYYDAKHTVNDYLSIDIRKWGRNKLLVPGTSFVAEWFRDGKVIGSIRILVAAKSIHLTYRHNASGQWQDMSYSIDIKWTPCNLGGKRPWFICPAKNCDRRVAILYGGAIFACRHCYQLTYPSQRENTGDRASRKADKIRDRLKWEPGILNGDGLKPKGMHWKTFKQLCSLHDDLVQLSLQEATLRFGINMLDLY